VIEPSLRVGRGALRPRPLAAVLFAALLGGVVVLLNDSPTNAPHGVSPPATATSPVTPFRVVSGDEIATGFGLGGDRIVTVAHALDAAATVDRLPVTVDGTPARLIRIDRHSDIALLAVAGLRAGASRSGPPALETVSARERMRLRLLRIRDGRPSPLSVDVRRAIVAHVRTAGAERAVTRPALEIEAHISPGDSGAPLVSDSGALAGVVFAASRGRENTAYAVDASAVKRLIAPR
jgi:S1-C subfamily serine protease